MPWCEECNRWYAPSALARDGSCPAGGHGVLAGELADAGGRDEALPRAPWHFWVLVAGIVLYLGWRLAQGLGWLAGRL